MLIFCFRLKARGISIQIIIKELIFLTPVKLVYLFPYYDF